MLNTIDRFEGDFFFLSNFYPINIEYDGITYLSSEAAFQAQKCYDKEDRYKFSNLTASESKRLGRSVSLRPDWEGIKISTMKNIVKCKFDQNPKLKEMLIDTKGYSLVEGNTWNDKFWGVCNGKGENHLGIILMELRDEYLSD